MHDPSDTYAERPRLRAQLVGVSAGFRGGTTLRDIDFHVHAGEVALVTGATATGKSTLLHVLRLALPPAEGEAIVLGRDARRLSARARALTKRRIGYVAEHPILIEQESAFDNVALPLRLAGRRIADFEEDVRALISFVGLNASADEPAWRLSAVERRRVAIARALAGQPELILADAPTAGLSPEAAAKMARLVGEMRRMGAGIVITSQDENTAAGLDATLWRLSLGRLSRLTPYAEAAE